MDVYRSTAQTEKPRVRTHTCGRCTREPSVGAEQSQVSASPRAVWIQKWRSKGRFNGKGGEGVAPQSELPAAGMAGTWTTNWATEERAFSGTKKEMML
jgi:hypothetical protein